MSPRGAIYRKSNATAARKARRKTRSTISAVAFHDEFADTTPAPGPPSEINDIAYHYTGSVDV